MIARAAALGSVVFAGSRGGNRRKVLVICLVVLGLFLYVGGKVKIVQLGYRIEALEREKQGLERRNRELRIEASSLASPARIEEIAVTRLGMVRPGRENIVTVERKE